MATSTYGTPYAASTDTLSGWPAMSQNVAGAIDAIGYQAGRGLNAQTGTTYTLVLTDAGKTITLSNASAVTVTMPTNSSVAFPTGTIVRLVNRGAGTVTISGSVTFQPSGSITLTTNEGADLQKVATDTWQRIDSVSVLETSLAAKANLASPTFTGTVALPSTTTLNGVTLQNGGMTLITSATLSGSATTINNIPATYKDLRLIVRNLKPSGEDYGLLVRVNGDSTANRHASTNFGNARDLAFNLAAWQNGNFGNSAGVANGFIQYEIFDYANTTTWKTAVSYTWDVSYSNTALINYASQMNAYNQTGAISSLTLLLNTGTFTSGSVLLYGIA